LTIEAGRCAATGAVGDLGSALVIKYGNLVVCPVTRPNIDQSLAMIMILVTVSINFCLRLQFFMLEVKQIELVKSAISLD
jgi:hypothetical protein